MRRRDKETEARRAALKVMVPYAHLMAGSFTAVDPDLAAELRRLGCRMDAMATEGLPSVLAALFGALSVC